MIQRRIPLLLLPLLLGAIGHAPAVIPSSVDPAPGVGPPQIEKEDQRVKLTVQVQHGEQPPEELRIELSGNLATRIEADLAATVHELRQSMADNAGGAAEVREARTEGKELRYRVLHGDEAKVHAKREIHNFVSSIVSGKLMEEAAQLLVLAEKGSAQKAKLLRVQAARLQERAADLYAQQPNRYVVTT